MSKPDRLIGNWILLLAAMVFGMVAGGGHARTIGAGYIMQVWQPFTGFIPPRTDADWTHLFQLYQQTSQYKAMHPPMQIAQFKALFWPMFLDRVWGRIMALVLLVPLAVFIAKGRISARLAWWLLALFAFGGLQAAYGWLMVTTGLRPGVLNPPPEWLAPHFVSGMVIFGLLIWTGLSVKRPVPERIEGGGYLKHWLNLSIFLIIFTMGLGALVAATDAITVYNSFPLMGGRWVPADYFALHPGWLNLLENKAAVQFDHRVFATITALTVLITAILGLRETLPPGPRDAFLVMTGLVSLQYLLGMVTIISGSVDLGYVHELNAVLLLAAAIVARHGLRGAGPRPMLDTEFAAAE
ncbi:MAG TPA: COX15/CtaA family protein [Acidocella sp.]|nr:COX15/CtaA family protein [Acidocella sp.]HQU03101.1 COX15/CtaA family protein [Acidocella sp.]